MSEISKYEAYKKKLQGVCDENDLVFRFRPDRYPITLTIRPVSGVEEQMSMLENVEDNGYTSPDASLVFSFRDGALTYKISETFTIGDALFSKLKILFKNMHFTWLQFFFRDVVEKGVLTPKTMPVIDESDNDTLDGAEPLESFEDGAGEEYGDDGTLPGDGEEDGESPDDDGGRPAVDLDDPVLQEAARIVRAENRATASLLQRHMSIGYAKAARIMDALEQAGVVGPFNGSEPREVLPYDTPEDPAEQDTTREGAGDDEA